MGSYVFVFYLPILIIRFYQVAVVVSVTNFLWNHWTDSNALFLLLQYALLGQWMFMQRPTMILNPCTYFEI